jgi:hypothetical protein
MSHILTPGLHKRRPHRLVRVGERPKEALQVGTRLTDGNDDYIVNAVDEVKLDGPWIELYNLKFPETLTWFRLEDAHVLFYSLHTPKGKRLSLEFYGTPGTYV